MAALPLLDPGINPAHDATIAGCKYLLGVEVGLRGAGKELLPEGPDATPPLKALTVRLRSSILEGAVVAHEPHDSVDVMAVEGVVEATSAGADGVEEARVADLGGVLRELDVDPRDDVAERSVLERPLCSLRRLQLLVGDLLKCHSPLSL